MAPKKAKPAPPKEVETDEEEDEDAEGSTRSEGESSSDQDDDDDDDAELIGHLEDRPTPEEARLLTRKLFPSKVGGRPAWLVPSALPSAGALACSTCARPLRFLLQVYASRGEQTPCAFHRTLHVFVCTNCQPCKVRIFRAQLPKVNPFYSSEPPNAKKIAKALRQNDDRDPVLDKICCARCGLPRDRDGTKTCAECERLVRNKDDVAVFDEREISVDGATLPEEDEAEEAPCAADAGAAAKAEAGAAGAAAEATAKQAAEADAPATPASGAAEAKGGARLATLAEDAPVIDDGEAIEEVFTPGAEAAAGKTRDLVAEADAVLASAQAKGASEAVMEKLREYKKKVTEQSDSVPDASEQQVFDEWCKENGEKDNTFSKFQSYALENKGHMLRYNFGGEPLWFCSPGNLGEAPPPCERCGAPRVFEFQVQPQLISLLAGTPYADRLDYGIICAYVCSACCDPTKGGGEPYAEEFAFVQPEPRDGWLPSG